MQEPSVLVNTLEDLLVKEFRACQALHTLTVNERQALSKNEIQALANLVEHKEALLDELGQIDDHRRMVAQELAGVFRLASGTPSIAEIAAHLPADIGRRINHLREGIIALTAEMRELTNGNQALAHYALERADALQSFLLDLYRPTLTYQPPGMQKPVEAGAAWGVDQRT
ncbi:MAG: flagellar protein FlgN [Chloroflexi bacterium]|nr:flagellar protein FlgN [Chloroflexota bacterium]